MEKAVNTLRVLAAEAISNANSGHSGIALGAAPLMYAIYKNMNFDPTDGAWFNRDRFVMSAGHGSALLYATLKCFGVKDIDLKTFRKFGSEMTGHPELNDKLCVDCSTGPLGQGIAMAVGIALAEAKLNSLYKSAVDHYTYCLVGDGCLMEGASYEACSLAGLWKLGKLIVIYDCNQVTLDGTRASADAEDTAKRFESMDWNVIDVKRGLNDAKAVDEAIQCAKGNPRPTLIIAHTSIGYGSKNVGSNKAHGSVLTVEEIADLKKKWGISASAFEVDPDVVKHFKELSVKKIGSARKWKPTPALQDFLKSRKLTCKTKGLVNARDIGHEMLNQLATQSPKIWGGSADVASSTKMFVDGDNKDGSSKNIAYGVREFAMAAISNGLALHGYTPFCSTFFGFSDYCKPAMRITALMDLPVTYIFTHDGLGNPPDGPTHQATEHIVAMRLVPNIKLYRPSSESETALAFESVFNKGKPACIVLARGDLNKEQPQNTENPRINMLSTGSEVALCIRAQKILRDKGINANVQSIPCLDEFDASDIEKKIPVLGVELGNGTSFWALFGKNNLHGDVLSFDNFGKCGKDADVLKWLGFTPENIANKAIDILK
ncbi:MAG: transketolase [Christensenellaceae bacterium]|jgi:transketolase|nr:transketolase [Christensenellaceae bacterium]